MCARVFSKAIISKASRCGAVLSALADALCVCVCVQDGGCQYVRCRTCNTTFCWLCMGVFDHKNHDCNKLELAADATDAAKSLAKWVRKQMLSSVSAMISNHIFAESFQQALRRARAGHFAAIEADADGQRP